MGTGKNRRRSDRVIIRPQATRNGSGKGEGAKVGGGQLKCPLSIRVELRSEFSDRVGSGITLRWDGSEVALYLGRAPIARLGSNRSELIGSCIQSGYHYAGKVKKTRNGGIYGELIRTP
jgi:hypothetical protein